MTTACRSTTPATETRSLLSTGPEMGRGQASLWTAAAAPDHRLWTTLRGPLDPSRLPTCPLPRRRRRASRYLSIPTNQRRDGLTTFTPSPSRRAGTGQHRQPPNRWAIPEHRSGPYRLVKSTGTIPFGITETAVRFPTNRPYAFRRSSDSAESTLQEVPSSGASALSATAVAPPGQWSGPFFNDARIGCQAL
jgi:hypothetical protein